MNDLRFAFRQLLKNPGFTAVAVLTLALGIGASAAIFSVIYGVLLKPLPYDQPGQLVRVNESATWWTVTPGVFFDWKDNSTSFEHLSIVQGSQVNLTAKADPERLVAWNVSANFVELLRVPPLLGRGFLPNDDKPGFGDQVVMLTHALWKSRFGGERDIVGSTIRLDSQAYTVIGVLPPKALFSPRVQLLVPLVLDPNSRNNRSLQAYSVYGRLKSGVTLTQAEDELWRIKQRLRSEYPKHKADWRNILMPLDEMISGRLKATLFTLLGGVTCLLLIACINVANLLLARAASRQKEMAIRAALGASRWRVIGQVLTESLLLAAIGGGLGILLAWVGVSVVSGIVWQPGGQNPPFPWEVHLDSPMLAFSLLLSLGTGIVFGLVPALAASRRDLNGALKKGGRTSAGNLANRIHQGLVVSEIALALSLLVVTGLFFKSLVGLLHVPTGFKPEGALVMEISLPTAKYPHVTSRARFFQQCFDQLAALAGVEAVGSATTMPMWNYSLTGGGLLVEGRRVQPEQGYEAHFDRVRGQYFRAIGIPILSGRDFAASDYLANATPVCLFNDELVRKIFANEDPLGKRIRYQGRVYEIIGVTGSIRHLGLDQGKPDARLYLSQVQPTSLSVGEFTESLIVRTRNRPMALADSVRKEILQIDPDQPVANVHTLEQSTAQSVAHRRLTLQLLTLFTGAALLLAAVGLYGVMAYSVTQRTHEIGIRMALGARRADVLKLILKNGIGLALLGVAVGLAGALAVTRVVKNQLYEVSATDPTAFAGVSLLLVAVALFACWLPARRAAKTEPMEALRHE
jgi:predicted permease